MKHRPRPPEQNDLFRPRLVDMIDRRHELVSLAALIDWDFFEREWAGFFPSATGRPATSARLVAGLLYLQHAFRLSDEAVVARWVENPYFQHFTGETFFQHKPPIDPTSLIRWRKRIGEEGVEWLLTKTIEAGRKSGAVEDASLDEIAVDTTVMEKNIAHPTDSDSTSGRAINWWIWPGTPGSSCGRATGVSHRVWRRRSVATRMRNSSGACARR
jgi:IS5 family transposase